MKQKITSLDGLRAIAITMVLIYHINYKILPAGFLGVNLFFVLSGFLFALGAINKLKSDDGFDLKSHYLNRFKRIIPPLYMVLFVLGIMMLTYQPNIFLRFKNDLLMSSALLSNWWYIWNKVSYFNSFGMTSIFKHLWYISLSEQIFLLLPILFFIFSKNKRNKLSQKADSFKSGNSLKFNQIPIILIMIIFASLSAYRMFAMYDLSAIDRIYYGTDTRAFEILVGALFAFLYNAMNEGISEDEKPSDVENLLITLFSIVFIGLIVFASIALNEFNQYLYTGLFLAFDCLVGLLIVILCTKDTFIYKFLSSKPLKYLAQRSYCIYLVHFPIIVITTPVSDLGEFNLLIACYQLIAIAVTSEIIYQLNELLINNKSIFRFRYKGKFAVSHALLIAFIAILITSYSTPYKEADEDNAKKPWEIELESTFVEELKDKTVSSDSAQEKNDSINYNISNSTIAHEEQNSVENTIKLSSNSDDEVNAKNIGEIIESKADKFPPIKDKENNTILEITDVKASNNIVEEKASDKENIKSNSETNTVVSQESDIKSSELQGVKNESSINQTIYEKHEDVNVVEEKTTDNKNTSNSKISSTENNNVVSVTQQVSDEKTIVSSKSEKLDMAVSELQEPIAKYDKILAIGDSTMMNVQQALEARYSNIKVDGKVSRQLSDALRLAKNYSSYNSSRNAVIIALGTNGPFSEKNLRDVFNAFALCDIYCVNVSVPKSWESDVNSTIASVSQHYSNVKVIDWHSAANGHKEYFAADRVHLNQKGIKVMMSLYEGLLD